MSSVLRVENLHKEYPGVVAVNDISFELGRGKVLALLGENGAGKSTLSKLICGVEKPDRGSIYLEEEKVSFRSATDALARGVSMVHQELSIIGDMSIAENIFMNRQPVDVLGNVKWNELYKNTREILSVFQLDLDPRMLAKSLPVGTQQLIEILRATSMDSKLIILDEPTSSLAEPQIQMMFRNIERLKAKGFSFIYITHKLEEVFQIADRVLVMRDGMYIGESSIEDITSEQIVTMMVGREIRKLFGEENNYRENSENIFEVRNLTAEGFYEDISFGVKKGEILGVSGLIGAGRTEMALGIFGMHKRSGRILINGTEVEIKTPADAIKNGIAYVTEDRKKLGLYLNYCVKDNLAVMQMRNFSSGGMIKKSRIRDYARKQVADFRIAVPSIDQTMDHLSGGNQQKCLLSMWMGIEPDIFIVDEPTRGVDVGAKAEIYQMLKNLSNKGNAVIVISSELPELIGVCNRIVVMRNGSVSGEVLKEDFSEDRIMMLATGVNKQ
ncbi:MAG TPA: sugar ABC transporter ATP-binding protein [Anaerovoracaceae bacterium]|nr:sugar ABC transporter ATP-binding protein [Anaerovoracaceae bacterium]